MGIFSLTQEIAMDLGTANTVIIHNGKIVVDQPSVVALDRRSEKLEAIGFNAARMRGRENPNIYTVRPLRDGVIADFHAAELLIRGLIKMIPNKNHLFTPSLRMMSKPSFNTSLAVGLQRRSIRMPVIRISTLVLVTFRISPIRYLGLY